MHRSIKGAVVGLAMGVALLTACGGDDAADLKKQLTDEGMDSATAECVVKGLQSRGVDLSQYGEPSAEDTEKITEAVSECMLGDLTIPTTP